MNLETRKLDTENLPAAKNASTFIPPKRRNVVDAHVSTLRKDLKND
jgi:hypothetical protein